MKLMKKVFLMMATVVFGMSSIQMHGMNVERINASQLAPLEGEGVGIQAVFWMIISQCSRGLPSEEIVEMLGPVLDSGVDVNQKRVRDGQEFTPLAYAICYGYGEVVRLLVADGANVNQRFLIEGREYNCLAYALDGVSNDAMVDLLIELGAAW